MSLLFLFKKEKEEKKFIAFHEFNSFDLRINFRLCDNVNVSEKMVIRKFKIPESLPPLGAATPAKI